MATRTQARNAVLGILYAYELGNHASIEDATQILEEKKIRHKQQDFALGLLNGVLANLKLANKYDFKNGTKGFIELAKWAENARFNLSSLGSMIEKVQGGGLEGTITQAAKLQVLGGNFARNADPLSMLYNAYADPESYAKQTNDFHHRWRYFQAI